MKTISENGLTLELSNSLMAVINFLRWHQNTKNTQFLVEMLYYLKNSGKIEIDNFTKTCLEILGQKSKTSIEAEIEKRFGIRLKQSGRARLNLYNFIEYYVQELSVEGKETDYLLNFLEMLFNFSQNSGNTIKDFLKYWDEEGRKSSIQMSENIDAIQMMTIHKAKGLEFSIVFLPMKNPSKKRSPEGWFDLEDHEIIQSVNISNFTKSPEEYLAEDMQEFNEINTNENLIDRLCVQYVATTRAVDQMFFYLQNSSEDSELFEIYQFVKDFQPKTEEQTESFDLYPMGAETLKKEEKENKNSPLKTLSIERIHSEYQEKNNIVIATPSKNYQQKNTAVRNGIFIHEILSKINSKDDISRVLNLYILDGILTHEESKEIEKSLDSIVNHPEYQEYFSEENTIINERDIMISDVHPPVLYRPDRLIKTKSGFKIIDFKTGEKLEKHQEQIEKYKWALEKIGENVIETKLIYL